METEKRIMETTFRVIISGASNSFPMVTEVPFPAKIAPKKTITPNNPGIKLLRSTLAPYAAEKAGPVPLPPMFIEKNMAIIKGNNNGLNKGEIIYTRFKFLWLDLNIVHAQIDFYLRSKVISFLGFQYSKTKKNHSSRSD